MTFRDSAIALFLAAGLLSSCGSAIFGLQRLGLRVRSRYAAVLLIDSRISERANRNRPVSADLVLVYEEDLVETLSTLSGKDWFGQRDQIQVDHRGALSVFAWEWVPGQDVPIQAVPLSARVIAGFLFSEYDSPGEHRVKIDPRENISIAFQEHGFTVTPKK